MNKTLTLEEFKKAYNSVKDICAICGVSRKEAKKKQCFRKGRVISEEHYFYEE